MLSQHKYSRLSDETISANHDTNSIHQFPNLDLTITGTCRTDNPLWFTPQGLFIVTLGQALNGAKGLKPLTTFSLFVIRTRFLLKAFRFFAYGSE